MSSIRSQTVSGMFWSLLQSMGGRGLSLIVTVVLARLLTPEMFGLIGMLAVIIELSSAVIVAGFNDALIREADADERDYSSVFWINLTVSLILYFILFLGAPVIAAFYKQPELTNLTRVLTLVFVINGFSYVQEARLRKKMSFKTLTIIHLPSVVISGAVGVLMAIRGYGVWSIVGMELTSRIAFGIQIWIYSKWYPLFVFDPKRIKKLFSFGSKLMFSAMLSSVYRNIYLVVIGKFFPLSSVGFYQTAYKVVNTPSSTLSSALNNVAFPAFSLIQADNARLKEGYKKIIRQVLFWLCPAFMLSALMAAPLFGLIFGEKWLPAVPYFRILFITGIFYPLSAYNLSIVNVKGRSDIFLKLEVIKKVIITIGIACAIPFGIWALIWFQSINAVFSYFLNGHFSGKFINYPIKEQLIDVMPVFLLSGAVCLIVYLLETLFAGFPNWFILLTGYGIGGGIYWLSAYLLQFSPYLDFMEILKSRVKRFSFR